MRNRFSCFVNQLHHVLMRLHIQDNEPWLSLSNSTVQAAIVVGHHHGDDV